MADTPWFQSLTYALDSLNDSKDSIIKEEVLYGGCISTTSVLTLSSGKRVFIKKNSAHCEDLFLKEAAGLMLLGSASGGLRVPEVLAGGVEGDTSFLLMEYIAPGKRNRSFSEDMGRSLVSLHKSERNKSCGLEYNNYLGLNPQYNSPITDWIDFFRTRRLEYQLRMARDQGRSDSSMTAQINRILDRLDNLLIPCDEGVASLLHGDLWSGNYLCGTDGRAVFIDPAVYYGHREADIAMTELFGGFDQSFYRAYNEVWPLEKGYRERRDLYNLYHMLNHLNLFGGSYARSVLSISQKYS